MASKKTDAVKKNFVQIFYAIIAALIIRSFLYEPFSIPSGSMYPNLKVGDYLFVSKFSYEKPKELKFFNDQTIPDEFDQLILINNFNRLLNAIGSSPITINNNRVFIS